MANTAYVNVGKPDTAVSGGVSSAPLGTAIPVDATTALDPEFTNYGFISEDGLTETNEKSSDKIKAWGGRIVKNLQTDSSASFSFSFIESSNADVLKAICGENNVTVTPADETHGAQITAKFDLEQLPSRVWNFDVKDGKNKVRVSVPNGQITELGDVTYGDEDVIAYEVTVDALWDDTLKAYYVKYLDNGQPTTAP